MGKYSQKLFDHVKKSKTHLKLLQKQQFKKLQVLPGNVIQRLVHKQQKLNRSTKKKIHIAIKRHPIIDALNECNNIIMKYQKLISLLNNAVSQSSKFRRKKMD